MSPPLLSVAIITHNEEQNLPCTLVSVQWADEIIVVDSGSTDRTVEIARSFNARGGSESSSENGQASPRRKTSPSPNAHRRLLDSRALDADVEELTPELQQEIRTLLASPTAANGRLLSSAAATSFSAAGSSFWRRFYPDPKLRLFPP